MFLSTTAALVRLVGTKWLSPSSTALLSPGRDHIPQQRSCHCWISPGQRLCLAGAALQIPGSSRLQPVLLPSPRASTRQCHLPLPRELRQGRHNIPPVPAGAKVVAGWNPELQHIVSPQGVFFQASYILLVCPNIGHLYSSKATDDFDVFPLIHMYFFSERLSDTSF